MNLTLKNYVAEIRAFSWQCFISQI